jgi:hypothetical protein
LDHYGISRQQLVETKDEQVKDLMVDIDLQVRELSERAWKHILETVIYHCDSDDIEIISSEFACEVDSHYEPPPVCRRLQSKYGEELVRGA